MKRASASSGGTENSGAPGHEGQQRAADGQEHRIRRAEAARAGGQQDRGEEEREQLFEFGHPGSSPAGDERLRLQPELAHSTRSVSRRLLVGEQNT